MILFYLISFLFLILLVVGIGYVMHAIIKTYGNKKYAKYFTIVYSFLCILLAVQMIFEDELFSQSDALELINEQDLKLTDNFKIVNNESSSAIGDYFHTFELEISENDKTNAINEIKASKNFKLSGTKVIDYLYSAEVDRYEGEKQIQNYETEYSFIREYFKPNGNGYAPTFRRIVIDKKQNKLKFQDIIE